MPLGRTIVRGGILQWYQEHNPQSLPHLLMSLLLLLQVLTQGTPSTEVRHAYDGLMTGGIVYLNAVNVVQAANWLTTGGRGGGTGGQGKQHAQ